MPESDELTEIEEAVEALEETAEPAPAATSPAEPPAEPAPPSDDEDDGSGDPTKSGGKRLAPSVWAEIVAHWEYGTMTGAEMGRKYDVSATSLHKYFKRHGITQNSKRHLLTRAAEEKIVGTAIAAEDPLAIAFEAKRKGRIAATREHLYGLSAANHARAVMIAKEWHDKTRSPAETANDLKALRHMEMLIERNLANRFKILNAEHDIGDGEMPILGFRDLSQEEISRMQQADEEDELGLPTTETLIEDVEDDEIVEEGGKLVSS